MTQDYEVRDLGLAGQGEKQVNWAFTRMPVLREIKRKFQETEPLKGKRVSACLHVTKETGVLVLTLKAGGAEVFLCGSNPLSTQDHVAAYLVKQGVHVYAWRGMNEKEYYGAIDNVLECKPDILHDDGADLIVRVHERNEGLSSRIAAGMEETTTGVIRLTAMERQGRLKFPVIAVNNAKTKTMFDNRYGTGQSTLDGIMRATSTLLAGKHVVVCGYGWCGRGIAFRARGMGCIVTVCEINPLKALEAVMDGFNVDKLENVAGKGDIFITATGCKDVIRKEHMVKMKDGVFLANSGHFNVEINLNDLNELSVEKKVVRPCIEEFKTRDGKKIYLLGEGRLVNLVCGEGHPPEVMDMSFANQALCAEHVSTGKIRLEAGVYNVPEKIDSMVAELKLKTMGIEIDELSLDQKRYLESWKTGT